MKLTPKDLEISATASDVSSLISILKSIKNAKINQMIDLGCAYGGLTKFVSEYLHVSKVYGVDLDESRLSEARLRGINTYRVNLNDESLPFRDNFFDLVTSFGVLEHLTYFDNLINESFRVLDCSGYLIISTPNLGSYINRIALLFGYQPRDIEISSKTSIRFLPIYGGEPIGHIRSATLDSIKHLLRHYGFSIVKVVASSPYSNKSRLLRALDKIFSFSPSLSRRFIILARKP